MKKLNGAVVLVTGASRGIGKHVAYAFARRGARLALAARTEDELAAVAAGVRDLGTEAAVLPLDMLDEDAVEGMAHRVAAALGPVDVLVNNAGIELIGRLHEVPFENIERVIRVNLLGTMRLTRSVVPGMLERGRGHVVTMASLSGHMHPPFYEAYASSKAGLIAFSHSLRGGLRGTGVSASVVVPSFVTEVGMRRYTHDDDGVGIAPVAGGVAPESVARAVVRAVRRDRAEILVAPLPTAIALKLLGGMPSVKRALIRISGVDGMYRRVVDRRGGGGFTGHGAVD